jgi:hypothetical protein
MRRLVSTNARTFVREHRAGDDEAVLRVEQVILQLGHHVGRRGARDRFVRVVVRGRLLHAAQGGSLRHRDPHCAGHVRDVARKADRAGRHRVGTEIASVEQTDHLVVQIADQRAGVAGQGEGRLPN